MWQALFKVSDRAQNRWSQSTQSVFWSEHITPCKKMGCSPYFVLTGTHPLLPCYVVEANYLLSLPESLISTTDLVARRAIALQKCQEDLKDLKLWVHQACNKAVIKFEHDHSHKIHDFDFKQGNLILIHNTTIKKALNHRMRSHYFRSMIICYVWTVRKCTIAYHKGLLYDL